MKFKNCTIHKEIDDAIMDAENLFLSDSEMMLEILRKNDFKYNSGTGLEIYRKLRDFNQIVNIFTYRPKWFLSKAIGYSDKNKEIIEHRSQLPQRAQLFA